MHKIWIELNWNWKKMNWIGIELKDSESDLNWNWIELKNPESSLNWNWIELKEMNWSDPWYWWLRCVLYLKLDGNWVQAWISTYIHSLLNAIIYPCLYFNVIRAWISNYIPPFINFTTQFQGMTKLPTVSEKAWFEEVIVSLQTSAARRPESQTGGSNREEHMLPWQNWHGHPAT